MRTFVTLDSASIRGRHGKLRACVTPMAACLAIFALAGAAGATTLNVTNLNDSGAGSLRGVIASAGAGDTIQFQVTGTITLTSGEILISRNLTITGPGASQLSISGNHTSRVFEIGSDATVSLSGLTIQNGVTGIAYWPQNINGGGIYNSGTLTITNCTISGNSADSFSLGGGIGSSNGVSTSLTIVGSTISGNSAGTAGGIYHGEGSLTITDSTVTNNTGTSQAGGIATRGQMTISGSTISNNNGGSQGGGLLELSGTGTIVNSTFSGNTTTGAGGAIAAFSSDPTTIRNTTIAGNTSVYNGTVFNLSTSTWAGVILANNTGANCFSSPAVISQGYNISDDGTCGLTAATDKENVSEGAGLDPKGLQNNGGPTQTIALLPASPAVNVIPAANCTLATDQRGTSRPQGAGCDAGAYELVLTVPFSSFNANLVISTGKIPGFALTSWFTLAGGSPALQLQTQTLTLQIANYTLTLPSGSLHPLWNASNAPLGYDGTINGARLVIALIPLGNNNWSFNAAGTPVAISATNPVPVTLTIGQNTGTTRAPAIIR